MSLNLVTGWIEAIPQWSTTAAYVLWVVGATFFMLLHKRRPVTTVAWLLAFYTVPFISGLGYFLFGPRRLNREKGLRQAARRYARDSTPERESELPEGFEAEQPLGWIARATRADDSPSVVPSRAHDITLYEDGDAHYPALLQAIADAKHTLHLEYYIWQPDGIGERIRDALARRAAEGVRVRLVFDSIGAKNCTRAWWRPLVDAGAELRTFNPPRVLEPQPGKMNFRTHRKILIADARIGFVGGINVSDDNTTGEAGRGNRMPWRSTHARIEGPPVAELQRVFLEDWLYGLPLDRLEAGKRTAKGLLPDDDEEPDMPEDIERWFPELDEPESGPWVQVVDSGPDQDRPDIRRLYFAAINAARHRLWITTPYFVPDEPIEVALRTAAARGVDVRIVLPENNDSKLVKAAAETYAASVMEEGAEVFMFEHRMNHSKTMIVDDSFSIVGTANMDNRSFRLNFEVTAAIWDQDINAKLAELFRQDLAQSHRFDPETRDNTLPQRLWMNTARLLSPLL